MRLFLNQYLWGKCESSFKKATSVVTSEFAKKTDLARLKFSANELVIDRLKTTFVDF